MSPDDKAIALGHPSYVWRFGQGRRLALIRRHAPLEGKRILDVGCGLGTYVKKMRDFSQEVYGVDVDPEKVAEASRTLPNIRLAPAEKLPFPQYFANLVVVTADGAGITGKELFRVLRPCGGRTFLLGDGTEVKRIVKQAGIAQDAVKSEDGMVVLTRGKLDGAHDWNAEPGGDAILTGCSA